MSEKLVQSDEDLKGCEGVRPLVQWLREEEQVDAPCPPCDLSVITPWYRDLLMEQGYPELADRVQAFAEADNLDIREVAKTLDDIKAAVGEEKVRKTLVLYDCMMETYEEGQDGQED